MKLFYLIILIFVLCMSGCGITPPTQGQLTAHQQTETAKTKCYDVQLQIEQRETAQFATIPEDQRITIILLRQQGEFAENMLSLATGRSLDPCKSTNLFDAEIVEVTEKNRTFRDSTGKIVGTVPWIVGGLTIDSLLDKTGSEVVNSYNSGSEINQNSKNSGSFNEVGGDSTIYTDQNSTSTVDNSTDNSTDKNTDNSTNSVDDTDVSQTDYEQCEADGGWYSSDCSCYSHYIAGEC